jgi:hypothetical protein
MSRVAFEPTIPVFGGEKVFHALYCGATDRQRFAYRFQTTRLGSPKQHMLAICIYWLCVNPTYKSKQGGNVYLVVRLQRTQVYQQHTRTENEKYLVLITALITPILR